MEGWDLGYRIYFNWYILIDKIYRFDLGESGVVNKILVFLRRMDWLLMILVLEEVLCFYG